MTFRPMPVMTICTVISLVILVMLGNWQYERFHEKMALPDIEVVQAETQLISLDLATDLGGEAQLLYGIMDGEAVWRRYVPAKLSTDGTYVMALLDATGGPDPVPLALADIERAGLERKANIFVRPPVRGTFTNPDQPEANLWFTFDADQMLAQYGVVSEAPVRVVEPINLTIRNSADLSRARQTINPYSTLKVRDPLPPQRHFGYALTWWGMAIGLLGVYLVFHHSYGRLRFRS